MSSAQPPPRTGAPYTGQPHGNQPYGDQQYGDQQYGGQPYGDQQYGQAPGQQYAGQQYAGDPHPGQASAGPVHGAGEPHARSGGSSASSDPAASGHYTDRDVSGTSVGTLLGDVTRDLSTLMRQELALAQAEVKQEVSKTAKGAGALSGAALAGYFVLLFLSIALWSALSNLMDAGWAGLIVAVLWGVIGAALFVVGRGQLRRVHPKPERTVDTLGQVPEALRPGHHPNAGPTTGGHR
jgi:hypothetical protein